jgi:hypothetical protein
MSWEKKQFDDKERAAVTELEREYLRAKSTGRISPDMGWAEFKWTKALSGELVGAPFKPIRPDSPFVTVDPVTGEPDPDRMP